MKFSRRQSGLSYVELTLALVAAVIVLAALHGLFGAVLKTNVDARARAELVDAGRAALDEMVRAVRGSPTLLLPQHNDPGTAWPENLREQTWPESAAPSGSLRESAVLSIALDPRIDRDRNGIADADNDADGRVNEDWPGDINNDGRQGVRGLDDDGGGVADEGLLYPQDDDEESLLFPNLSNDDPVDGIDNDGDGRIDEDPGPDMNGDGAPGIAGVDDDGDGNTDEGDAADDDEDGSTDEDWVDSVSFYLDDDNLRMRIPLPWDEDASGSVTGRDYVERILTGNVIRFSVERVQLDNARAETLALSLVLQNPDGIEVQLQTVARLGADL